MDVRQLLGIRKRQAILLALGTIAWYKGKQYGWPWVVNEYTTRGFFV